MRVLITGGGGFVGWHVAAALRNMFGSGAELLLSSRDERTLADGRKLLGLDVGDPQQVRSAINAWRPDHIIHLAGISAPRIAAANPDLAWRVHLLGATNLGEAVLEFAPDCQLIHVGSGLAYGRTAQSGAAVDENAALNPLDIYGLTKAAADLAMSVMAQRGVRTVRVRPFNHTGPYQDNAYVLPAFAAQLANIAQGRADAVLRVGNLEVERDFLDVRDVARAYALMVARAYEIAPGSIFNVASGTSYRLRDLLDELIRLCGRQVTVEVDPGRLRSGELPRVVGNADKLRRELDWQPEFAIEQTLADIFKDWLGRSSRNLN